YDRRGHGRSSHAGGGYDYDTLAGDLAAVLDGLDLRNVTLVGMSMAGGEMVRYITRHSARRIARIVFVATDATPVRLQTPDNPGRAPAGPCGLLPSTDPPPRLSELDGREPPAVLRSRDVTPDAGMGQGHDAAHVTESAHRVQPQPDVQRLSRRAAEDRGSD